MLKLDYNKINFYADSMVQMYVSKVKWWHKSDGASPIDASHKCPIVSEKIKSNGGEM